MIRKGSKCAFWIGGRLFLRSWIFSSKLWVDQQAFLQDGKSVTIRFKWCWLVCRQTVSFTFSHFPAKWQVQLGGSSQLSDESMSWTNYQTERMWTQVNQYLQKYHQKSSNITWSYRVPNLSSTFLKKVPVWVASYLGRRWKTPQCGCGGWGWWRWSSGSCGIHQARCTFDAWGGWPIWWYRNGRSRYIRN